MDAHLKRLEAARRGLGAEGSQHEGTGLARPVLQALDRYRALAATREEMDSLLDETCARLEAAASLLGGSEVAGLLGQLEARLRELAGFLDDPEALAELQPHLEDLGRLTERDDLADLLDRARAAVEEQALCEDLASRPIPEEDLEGALASVLETVEAFRSGELDPQEAAQRIRAERDAAVAAREDYERHAYLAPEEWTTEVALADRLLSHGLEARAMALEVLAERVAAGSGAGVEECLLALREAEESLLQVERLADEARRAAPG